MDYQRFTDCVDMPCCVMSVQKTAEGSCGEIRIVAANQSYREVMGPAYYDGMIYSELVPQDNKFEEYCFRAAILKQKMHGYVETRAFNCWTDQTLIPLASEEESKGYCQFLFEFTPNADAGRMATVSVNTAETVIEACIRLMGTTDITTSTEETLDVILKESGARAARIMLMNHEQKRAVLFCEKMKGSFPSRQDPDVITYNLIRTWEDMIGVSNAVIIRDEQDMEALEEKNPVWAASMRDNSVRSLVLVPLRKEKKVMGYLYVVNFDTSKVVEVKELVELMSFFIGSELYNHLLRQRLEDLTRKDVLTGAYNRRALIQQISALSEERPRPSYGIVNIDLNGLKIVNDEKGHEAGDRLLIETAEMLGKLFYQDDIFRTGGDEFVIISRQIGRETFDRKIQKLRAVSEKNGVSLAIGGFWSNGAEDLMQAFRVADEKMYENKKNFYDSHPEIRKR